MTFLHLHCHSDRTVGRGMIKPTQLVDHYVSIGVGGACITDNGNMNAAVQLYNACKKKAIKPIIGMEVNIVPDKSAKVQKAATLVLLAKNLEGFYNLVKIATVGSMYFYFFPRVDVNVIQKYSRGLIGLSSDVKGVAASAFFAEGNNGIDRIYDEYMTIFDGNFYWEIQPTQTESQRVYNEALLGMADGFDQFKLVASSDPHYLRSDQKTLHKSMMAGRNSRNASWEYPFRGEYHVLSRDEMVSLFTLLHGYAIKEKIQFCVAMDRPDQILESIETFDLRQGTKVPSFIE